MPVHWRLKTIATERLARYVVQHAAWGRRAKAGCFAARRGATVIAEMPRARRTLLLALTAVVACAAIAVLVPVGSGHTVLRERALPALAGAPFPAWAHHGASARAATPDSPSAQAWAVPPPAPRGSVFADSAGTAPASSAALPRISASRRDGGQMLAATTPLTPTPPPRVT